MCIRANLSFTNARLYAYQHRSFREDCRITSAYDYALVENALATDGENPIIACISLQKSVGYFGKVKLTYGTPEIVATHPGKAENGVNEPSAFAVRCGLKS